MESVNERGVIEMPYSAHNFRSGDILTASDLNEMDDQIASITEAIDSGSAGGGSQIIEQETGIEIVIPSSDNQV